MSRYSSYVHVCIYLYMHIYTHTHTHTHTYTHSSSGHYLLVGASNGSLRVHPLLPLSHSLSSLQAYWSLNMHDNHTGRLTHLTTTCDDRYVISAGEDGNVFVYLANLPSVVAKETVPKSLEVRKREGGREGGEGGREKRERCLVVTKCICQCAGSSPVQASQGH